MRDNDFETDASDRQSRLVENSPVVALVKSERGFDSTDHAVLDLPA
jgi:hypothetical protein